MDVRLPSGQIIRGVPDGISKSELRMRLLKNGIDPDGPQPAVNPTEGMSGSKLLMAGVGKSLVDTGRGLKQLFNVGDQEALTQKIAEERELAAPLRETGAGLAGEVAGQVGQFLVPGGAFVRGANLLSKAPQASSMARALGQALLAPKTYKAAALGGAAFGATQPSLDEGEAAMNTGLGALGGVGGQAAVKGIGALISPVRGAVSDTAAALARALEDRGVKLSTAQLKDSRPLKFLESAFASLPFTARGEAEKILTQNRQFTSAALKAVGESADEATPQVLQQARSRLGKTFEVLSSLPSVKLGDDMLNRLSALDSAQAEVRGVLETAPIDKIINGMLDKLARGELSGNAAQTIRSELTKEASAAAATNPRLASALKEVRDGVDSAIRDQLSPAQREAWDVAREQYAALKTIERAMSKTTEAASRGLASPAALGESVRAQDRARFPRAMGELATLARAGNATLRPPPSSGTAEREMMVRLLTGGGLTGAGAGASLATGDPTYAAMGAASLAAPRLAQKIYYTPTVQKYLTHGAGRVTRDALVKAIGAPLPKSAAPKIEKIIDSSLPDAAKRRIIASALRSATVATPATAATDSKRQ